MKRVRLIAHRGLAPGASTAARSSYRNPQRAAETFLFGCELSFCGTAAQAGPPKPRAMSGYDVTAEGIGKSSRLATGRQLLAPPNHDAKVCLTTTWSSGDFADFVTRGRSANAMTATRLERQLRSLASSLAFSRFHAV
jgi:hypothetical protein